MKHKCKFCNNYFSTKTNLNSHHRRAKYCLKLQGKSKLEDASIICKSCGKVSTSKWNHQLHLSTCKKSDMVSLLSQENDKLKKENGELTMVNKLMEKQLSEKDLLLMEKNA